MTGLTFNPYKMDALVRGILQSEGYRMEYHNHEDRLAYTDGRVIYVPEPSMDWDRNKLALWTYAVFHEQGHNSKTCNDIFEFVKLRHAKGAPPFKLQLLNVVDDYRQERLNSGAYAGRDEACAAGRLVWSGSCTESMREQIGTFNGDASDIREEVQATLYQFTDWLRANGRDPFMQSLGSLDPLACLSQRGVDWMAQLQQDHTDLEDCDTAEEEYRWLERVLRDVFQIESQEEQDKEEQQEPDHSKMNGSGAGDSDEEDGEAAASGQAAQGDGEGDNPVMAKVAQYEWTLDHGENADSNGTGVKLLYSDSEPEVHGIFAKCHVRKMREGRPVSVPPHNLGKQVQRLLTIRSRSRWEEGHKRGRLGRRVARMAVDNEHVFRKKTEALSLNKAVCILVDCSGSMFGDEIRHAKIGCAMLADAISPLGVPLEILGFQDGMRDTPEIFEVMRFGQKFNKQSVHKRIGSLEANGCNDDFSALLYAYHRLMTQKTDGHALIVLSDGSPAPNRYQNQITAVQRLVKQLEKSIDVYGIGINDRNVERIYTKNHVIYDPSELPTAILNFVKQALL